MSDSTSWTPGVAADSYNNNKDYLCVTGAGAEAAYNEEYMSAPGVRFVPSDQELIVSYLGRELRGESLPTDMVHHGKDAYAEHPKKLVPKLGEDIQGSWYLFSQRKRKYVGGMRPKRDMGDMEGHWKATGAEKPVFAGTKGKKVVIGTSRTLTFLEDTYEIGRHGKQRRVKDKSASKPTKWKMVEFVYINSCRAPGNDTALDPMLLNDCVLCKITDRSLCMEGEEDEEEQPTPDGGGGEPYEKHVHLPEQQQAGGGGAGTPAGQQQQGPSGGGAASHGNQQPAFAEAPLSEIDADFFGVELSDCDWFADDNIMSSYDLYDAGPANERQKPPGMLPP